MKKRAVNNTMGENVGSKYKGRKKKKVKREDNKREKTPAFSRCQYWGEAKVQQTGRKSKRRGMNQGRGFGSGVWSPK